MCGKRRLSEESPINFLLILGKRRGSVRRASRLEVPCEELVAIRHLAVSTVPTHSIVIERQDDTVSRFNRCYLWSYLPNDASSFMPEDGWKGGWELLIPSDDICVTHACADDINHEFVRLGGFEVYGLDGKRAAFFTNDGCFNLHELNTSVYRIGWWCLGAIRDLRDYLPSYVFS